MQEKLSPPVLIRLDHLLSEVLLPEFDWVFLLRFVNGNDFHLCTAYLTLRIVVFYGWSSFRFHFFQYEIKIHLKLYMNRVPSKMYSI